MHARAGALRLPIEAVWQVAALIAPFIVAAGVASLTADSWWAIKMGELSVATGQPGYAAVLAHTPTVEHPTNGQWLGQVFLYAGYTALGETGLRILAGLLMSTTFALLLVAARSEGGTPRISAVAVMVGVLLASSNVAPRAQLFAFPLFALTVLLLCRRHRSPHLTWLLPLIFGLWANIHGSFVLGPLLLGLHALGDGLQGIFRGWFVSRSIGAAWSAGLDLTWRYLPLLMAAMVATFINPLGPQVYGYVGTLTSHPMVSLIEEWRQTSLSDPTGRVFAVGIGLLLVALVTSRRRPSLSSVLVLLACGYLAVTAQRNVVWFGLLLVPVLARHASTSRLTAWAGPRWRLAEAPAGSIANTILAGCLVLVAAVSPMWRPLLAERLHVQEEAAEIAPAQAANVLASMPPGRRLYHYQPWTGYLAWRLWPTQLPFLDARVEAHPAAVWTDYLSVATVQHNWEAILDQYGVDYLALQRQTQEPLATAAVKTGRWRMVYEDDVALVLIRN
ncbi:MAG: hypothetical protein AB7K36_07655 [Chloroflexota bacterium]